MVLRRKKVSVASPWAFALGMLLRENTFARLAYQIATREGTWNNHSEVVLNSDIPHYCHVRNNHFGAPMKTLLLSILLAQLALRSFSYLAVYTCRPSEPAEFVYEHISRSPSQMECGYAKSCERSDSEKDRCNQLLRPQPQRENTTIPNALLNNSQLNVSDRNLFPCPVCDKCFRYPSKVLEHQQMHSGSRHAQCDICAKCFKRPSELFRHCREKHADKTNLPFIELKKTFRESEQRGNRCPLCDKYFTTLRDLRLHRESAHPLVERYTCEECPRTFSKITHARRHRKTVHGTENNIICEFCGKLFSRADSLRRHIISVHNLQNQKDPLVNCE
ncbi:zinc finger protein 836 [Clonorchis sinensis]|uniref:Zinc finger protein 836 n=1 Tax=Clonorchis sinensis TaxID=79923 RepID=G7YT37_CLOSI|nr:zinc finger protein 836 [Clonorchis sinensis]